MMHGSISGSLLISRVKSSFRYFSLLADFFLFSRHFLHPRDRASRKSRRESKLSKLARREEGSGVFNHFSLLLFARRAKSMEKSRALEFQLARTSTLLRMRRSFNRLMNDPVGWRMCS
jgi:hypothetical protein